MHLIMEVCMGRPVKCGLLLLAGVGSPSHLVLGTRSVSTIYKVPRKGQQRQRLLPRSQKLQGMASRGKFPLRNTTYTTDCASEVQRLIVSVAVGGIATTRLPGSFSRAKGVLVIR